METNSICNSCQNPISPTYFFCPYCGRKLREPPLSTSVWKQIGVYLFAVFVPPFGLIPGIRYIRQSDNKSKVVGIVTLLLTGVSLLISVYYFMVFMQYFNLFFSSPLGIDNAGVDPLNGLQ